MNITNRRALLITGVAVVGGMGMGGASTCTTGTNGLPTISPAIIDAIQKAVATGCSYVPAAETLLALLAMFPGIGGVTAIAGPLLTEVTNFLCQSFHAGGGVPAVLAKKSLSAALKGGSSAPIHGLVWDAGAGKFVEF
jgi:hypothetical protein